MPKNHKACPPSEAALLPPEVQGLVDNFRLENVASHLLRRAHFQAEDMFHQEFFEESLTPRQKASLVVVAQHPGLTQNALATHLAMDRNTVGDIVKRLCANALLTRYRASDDQRAYKLYISEAGAELLGRVLPRDADIEQRLLDRLPKELQPLFVKCLKLIVGLE